MDTKQVKIILKKVWDFVWHSNSIWSWIVNIILAFVIIKYLVYPLLGLILATSHPIVAVVSPSMEHQGTFDQWWLYQEDWYLSNNITKENFQDFPFSQGFNKGDIMILFGKKPEKLEVGDILVFDSQRPNPIIHRIVKKWSEDGQYHFQTKGDHNPDSLSSSLLDETDISEEKIIGKAIFRIPFLGWLKIGFVEVVNAILSLAR